MKAAYLQGDVVAICMQAAERITTVGAEQYPEGMFENETAGAHLKDLEEELLDVINYAAMAIIKLRRLAQP